MKPELRPTISVAALACLLLAMVPAQAKITLYSSTFGGSSGTNLNGTAVTTSGATAAQHLQYGTSATETWTADTKFKADGSFANSSATTASGTLFFDPKDGYVYTLSMTTNHAVTAPNLDWFGTGFFMQDNFSGASTENDGATVWALTRPGSQSVNGDQVAHYDLTGGAGPILPSASEDTTAPSTLTIVLDTTAGTGNWSATYYVGNDVLAMVADLGAVDIDAVGIAVFSTTAAPFTGKFQSFELSVAGDTIAPAITTLDPDEVSGVYPGTSLVATFSENIALTGGGSILIDDLTDSNDITINVINPSEVSVTGTTLTINPPTNLAPGKNYQVLIGPGTIQDTADPANEFPGTTAGQWTFSTAAQDLTAPVITLKSPLDNATGVSRATNIVATFDDDILAGTGNITIKDLDDGSTTRVIPVSDGAQVTISGKVLTVDPSAPLAAGRNYAVQIAAGAVKNFSDVGFAGIPASDNITWNFQTLAASPNVIFILGDDQAWYDYSFMYRPGVEKTAIDAKPSIYQAAQTPALDALADQGLTFTHGYSTPICRPSLASMITGAFPHRTLITGNDLVGYPPAPPDENVEARMQVLHPLPRTLANELGYTCFQTGKWWEGHHTNGGFTHGDTVNSTATGTAPPQWSGTKPSVVEARHGDWGLMAGRVDYVNDIHIPAYPIAYANTVQTVTNFINTQVAADQPFFLWYAPMLPHSPFDAPTGLRSKYDTLISEPDESGNYIANYYANIERFDGGVGAILDHLEAQGIANNTIVIYICDNGWINQTNSSSYAPRSKQSPYEGGIRTPIIVRWPDKIKVGGEIEPQIITTPVSLVDLVPTVHDALNLPTYPEMTGVSLLDLDAVTNRRTVFTEDSHQSIFDLNDPSLALETRVARRDGWKLLLFANGTKELYHLYDSSTGAPVDPHETNNLAASNPKIVSELTTAIVNWYAEDPNDFDSWIRDPGFGIPAGDQGFAQDPDGDNLENGIEAWFGTDPRAFTAGLVNLGTNGTTTTFTHPRNENPPGDLTGYYEWSPNLVDWYASGSGPGGGPTVTLIPNTSGSTTTVTANASGELGKLFLRARVVQN